MLTHQFPTKVLLIRHSELVSESVKYWQILKQVQNDALKGDSLLVRTLHFWQQQIRT